MHKNRKRRKCAVRSLSDDILDIVVGHLNICCSSIKFLCQDLTKPHPETQKSNLGKCIRMVVDNVQLSSILPLIVLLNRIVFSSKSYTFKMDIGQETTTWKYIWSQFIAWFISVTLFLYSQWVLKSWLIIHNILINQKPKILHKSWLLENRLIIFIYFL